MDEKQQLRTEIEELRRQVAEQRRLLIENGLAPVEGDVESEPRVKRPVKKEEDAVVPPKSEVIDIDEWHEGALQKREDSTPAGERMSPKRDISPAPKTEPKATIPKRRQKVKPATRKRIEELESLHHSVKQEFIDVDALDVLTKQEPDTVSTFTPADAVKRDMDDTNDIKPMLPQEVKPVVNGLGEVLPDTEAKPQERPTDQPPRGRTQSLSHGSSETVYGIHTTVPDGLLQRDGLSETRFIKLEANDDVVERQSVHLLPKSEPDEIEPPISQTRRTRSSRKRTSSQPAIADRPVKRPKTSAAPEFGPDDAKPIKIKKAKGGTFTLEDRGIKRRLAGILAFDVEADPELQVKTVTRGQFSKRHGGSVQTLDVRMPRTGQMAIFPTPEWNPLLPNLPGEPGMLFRWPGIIMSEDSYVVVRRITPNCWRYMGEYLLRKVEPLSAEEWLSQSDAVKRTWIHIHGKKNSETRATKQRVVAERGLRSIEDVTDEHLQDLFDRGEEHLEIFTMNCVGYREEFQRSLVEMIVPPSPVHTRRRRRSESL